MSRMLDKLEDVHEDVVAAWYAFPGESLAARGRRGGFARATEDSPSKLAFGISCGVDRARRLLEGAQPSQAEAAALVRMFIAKRKRENAVVHDLAAAAAGNNAAPVHGGT